MNPPRGGSDSKELEAILTKLVTATQRDEIIVGKPSPFDETMQAINSYTNRKVIEALKELLNNEQMVWVRRGEVDSHEQFVHGNLIRDRITELKREAGE